MAKNFGKKKVLLISKLTHQLAFESIRQCANFLKYLQLCWDSNKDCVHLDNIPIDFSRDPLVLERAINVVEQKSSVG